MSDEFVITTDEKAAEEGFQMLGSADTDVLFARESLIDGWDQAMISRARVMVVGAGALGNEALKNMALLGFRNIFIIDMDTISRSNLSRSVLFSEEDQGKDKAEAAAARTTDLCVAPDPNIRYFSGDLTQDLGSGVYRRMDVVLGCLDNVAARIGTDSNCWLFGVPWVEGGMAGYRGNVTVFVPLDGPCYVCTLSEADRATERQRYSCDQRKQRAALANQVPAVQTVSSVVAASQVQEALKLLQGRRESRSIFYDAETNEMSQSRMGAVSEHRMHHPTLVGRTIHEPRTLSSQTTLGDAMALLRGLFSADEVSIKLDHPFVSEAICNNCGTTQEVMRPRTRIWAEEYQECPSCGSKPAGPVTSVADMAIRLVSHGALDSEAPEQFNGLTLGQLGIPPLHVIQVRTPNGTQYVELNGDLEQVLGRWG